MQTNILCLYTSHGSVYCSDTRVVFKHTSNAGTLRHTRNTSGARWRLVHHMPDG